MSYAAAAAAAADADADAAGPKPPPPFPIANTKKAKLTLRRHHQQRAPEAQTKSAQNHRDTNQFYFHLPETWKPVFFTVGQGDPLVQLAGES